MFSMLKLLQMILWEVNSSTNLVGNLKFGEVRAVLYVEFLKLLKEIPALLCRDGRPLVTGLRAAPALHSILLLPRPCTAT